MIRARTTSASRTPLPSPAAHPVWGHLGHWGTAPLDLLRDGARGGPVFELRLPRSPVLVGYSPAWNRGVLKDTDTFRSRRSISALVPHLAGGIIMTDAPAHRARRQVLDRPFRDVDGLRERVLRTVEPLAPRGRFDALAWSMTAVKAMLNAALFSGAFPHELLDRYLHPLETGMPGALVPRIGDRRAVRAELRRQLDLRGDRTGGGASEGRTDDGGTARRGHDDLAGALAGVPGAVEELRVGLAAGFDTTAHTLAWCLWYLALFPEWRAPDVRRAAVDEVLRLHPAGFVGSRRAAHDVDVAGVHVPAGTMVLYSPLLTHHDPELWEDPERFDPSRFERGVRAWTYLPFSAGARTCLGTHLARLMVDAALDAVFAQPVRAVRGDPSPTAAVTIAPRGPLLLDRGDGRSHVPPPSRPRTLSRTEPTSPPSHHDRPGTPRGPGARP